jgi:hypothetical protein
MPLRWQISERKSSGRLTPERYLRWAGGSLPGFIEGSESGRTFQRLLPY